VTGPPRRAVLALGSNQGDRLVMLQGAVDVLAAAVDVVAVSPVFETDPVGGPAQDDFLNAVVLVEASQSPHQLLELAHRVEELHGRVREQRWGPRTLDVDVIAVGDERLDEPDLVLPHPRAAERAFVLVPWASVDPEAVLLGAGRIVDLLSSLDISGVRPRPDLLLRPAVGTAR
jgi:2-amino-4-hydroxy-6-hydroxymethyldihydropteridine diphosphokinase